MGTVSGIKAAFEVLDSGIKSAFDVKSFWH
jgi:hypothetical protein